jgi:hypothetical protein
LIRIALSAQMITTAITINTDGATVLSAGATYGILLAILVFHGIVCSAATRVLARLNLFYVVINGAPFTLYSHGIEFHCRPVGTTIAAIVILFVSPRGQIVSAHDAFTLFENNTGWSNSEHSFSSLFVIISP